MLTKDEVAQITGETDLIPLSGVAEALRAQLTWHLTTDHDKRACAVSLVRLQVLGYRALTGLLMVPLLESDPADDD